MPPTMITLIESARKSSDSWRARNFGYFDRIVLSAGFSKCDSSAMTPVCCASRNSW